MAMPAANVKIEFLKILKIPAKSPAAGVTRYARANFQAGSQPQISTGRSRPIPNSGGDFDLTSEASAWVFEANVNSGDYITISVDLLEDHGNDDPFLAVARATAIAAPWSSGVKTISDFQVRITTTIINPLDKALLARAAAASGVSGSLTVPQGFLVEFVDIKGLYKPNPAAVPPAQGAVHTPGYASADNLGRIFTNREPSGAWKSDAQFIDVQIKVTAFGGPTIPGGAKIDWTIVDVDDPTNDDSHFHRDWGPYVDANDYDAHGKPIGAHPRDNVQAFKAGNSEEDLLFGRAASGSPTARWAQVPGGPAPSASSGTRASTKLTSSGPKTAVSSVRIHCPNVLGTDFVLIAELIGTPATIPVHNARTGTMTMWCRLDVEVTRMAGAHSLSGALPAIPESFLPACVQLDFQKEREVHGDLDRQQLAAGPPLIDDASAQWASNSGVFTHVGQPGWFFLGGARRPHPMRVTETGKITVRSQKVTDLSSPGTPALSTGMSVSGDGIPVGTTILSIDTPNSITLSQAATLTHVGTSLTFGPVVPARTGDTTAGSKTITGLSGIGTTALQVGMFLGGDGIPEGATIHSITGPDSITISAPATATAAGVSLRFALPLSIFKGTGYSLSTFDNDVFLTVPHGLSEPAYVEFTWKQGGEDQSATFGVSGSNVDRGVTTMLLEGEDITPEFTGDDADGSLKKAYATQMVFYPHHHRLANGSHPLSPGGYGIPTGATLEVFRPGLYLVSGISPTVPHHILGTGEFFAGRTIVFTHHGKYSTGDPPAPKPDFDKEIVSVVAHELIHAFGMPHKCGNWDWRTPRKTSCCMNYSVTWLADARHNLIHGTVNKVGNDMCGRHLMEVRRVHLDRNVGLWW